MSSLDMQGFARCTITALEKQLAAMAAKERELQSQNTVLKHRSSLLHHLVRITRAAGKLAARSEGQPGSVCVIEDLANRLEAGLLPSQLGHGLDLIDSTPEAIAAALQRQPYDWQGEPPISQTLLDGNAFSLVDYCLLFLGSDTELVTEAVSRRRSEQRNMWSTFQGQMAILLHKVEALSHSPPEAAKAAEGLIQVGLQHSALVVGCILTAPTEVFRTQGHEKTAETPPEEMLVEVLALVNLSPSQRQLLASGWATFKHLGQPYMNLRAQLYQQLLGHLQQQAPQTPPAREQQQRQPQEEQEWQGDGSGGAAAGAGGLQGQQAGGLGGAGSPAGQPPKLQQQQQEQADVLRLRQQDQNQQQQRQQQQQTVAAAAAAALAEDHEFEFDDDRCSRSASLSAQQRANSSSATSGSQPSTSSSPVDLSTVLPPIEHNQMYSLSCQLEKTMRKLAWLDCCFWFYFIGLLSWRQAALLVVHMHPYTLCLREMAHMVWRAEEEGEGPLAAAAAAAAGAARAAGAAAAVGGAEPSATAPAAAAAGGSAPPAPAVVSGLAGGAAGGGQLPQGSAPAAGSWDHPTAMLLEPSLSQLSMMGAQQQQQQQQ